MLIKFNSEIERQNILTEYATIPEYIFIGECNHTDGNFLKFEHVSIHNEKQVTGIRNKQAEVIKNNLVPYHQMERDTWFIQTEEANAWILDNDTPAIMLRAIARERNVDISIMVNRVIEKNNAYRELVGTLLGQQQKEIDDIIPIV